MFALVEKPADRTNHVISNRSGKIENFSTQYETFSILRSILKFPVDSKKLAL